MFRQAGFGVIGAGTWGDLHARIYSTEPYSRLVAVCDKDEDRARDSARRYGAARYYTDVAEMVKDDEIQAVSVATPDFAHREPAVTAALAGKHVLVEKPLATTSDDCTAILDAARKTGVKLMVDFHNRFNPAFEHAREAVASGELGRVVHGDMKHSDTLAVILARLAWSSKSSAMWFLGSHCIDILRWVQSDDVVRVYCVAPRTGVLKENGIDSPDCFQTTLEFAKGAVIAMENSWVLPEAEPTVVDYRLYLVGSKGAIKVNVAQNDTVTKYAGGRVTNMDALIMPTVHGKVVGYAPEAIRHFVSCVAGDAQPIPTGEDGLVVTRTIEAIYRSLETGVAVAV